MRKLRKRRSAITEAAIILWFMTISWRMGGGIREIPRDEQNWLNLLSLVTIVPLAFVLLVWSRAPRRTWRRGLLTLVTDLAVFGSSIGWLAWSPMPFWWALGVAAVVGLVIVVVWLSRAPDDPMPAEVQPAPTPASPADTSGRNS